MGIYDRDYYRKEGPSFLGSLASPGQVCKWLVIVNVGIYILQLVTDSPGRFGDLGFVTESLSMKPVETFKGLQIWRLLTAAFLHDPDNFFHIVWNMFFLWWLGNEMEELYGHREFLAFYLVAAVVGNAFWGIIKLLNPPVPMPSALGASGAVTAVLVLYTLHFPTRRIYFWFISVPMWLLTIIYVGADLHSLLRGNSAMSGVAVECHIGGAALALAYWQFDWRFAGFWPSLRGRASRKPRLRLYREEVAAPVVAAAPSERVDEQLEAKVDRVLEKVAQVGVENLTPEEQALLKRASEIYKRRRT
jgi:membrane associated rhomboid family serine protease